MYNTYYADKFCIKAEKFSIDRIRWIPPENDSSKLNFDGSVLPNKDAASSFILRNKDGNVTLAFAKKIGRASVLRAEAFALRAGLHAALIHGHRNINVEGDSKILIDCINNKGSIPWKISSIVRDIKILASSFNQISFIHIWREANFGADAVANIGHSRDVSAWTENLPEKVSRAVLFDKIGYGCIRGFKL